MTIDQKLGVREGCMSGEGYFLLLMCTWSVAWSYSEGFLYWNMYIYIISTSSLSVFLQFLFILLLVNISSQVSLMRISLPKAFQIFTFTNFFAFDLLHFDNEIFLIFPIFLFKILQLHDCDEGIEYIIISHMLSVMLNIKI